MKVRVIPMNVSFRALALGAIIVALVGCGGGSPPVSSSPAPSTTSTSSTTYTPPNVDAGVPVERSADEKPYKALVASSGKYGYRPDPFALSKEEQEYDRQQNAERVISTMGGFRVDFELPPEKDESVQIQEPQPYRRLAGIVVGDSVLAIIDMGNGQPVEIIRPGMKVPNTEWTVVSIDQDKAVLHRDGRVAPHTVTVRLESPPAGVGGNSGFNPGGMGAPGGNGARGPKMGTPGGAPGGAMGAG